MHGIPIRVNTVRSWAKLYVVDIGQLELMLAINFCQSVERCGRGEDHMVGWDMIMASDE